MLYKSRSTVKKRNFDLVQLGEQDSISAMPLAQTHNVTLIICNFLSAKLWITPNNLVILNLDGANK